MSPPPNDLLRSRALEERWCNSNDQTFAQEADAPSSAAILASTNWRARSTISRGAPSRSRTSAAREIARRSAGVIFSSSAAVQIFLSMPAPERSAGATVFSTMVDPDTVGAASLNSPCYVRGMAATSHVSALINTERYPIHALDSDSGQAFVADCRRRMAAESSLTLPEFVRADVVADASEEVAASPTVTDERLRTPYSWRHNLDHPEGHPRRALFRARLNAVLDDSFAADSLGRRIFECDELTEFVRQLLQVDTLYRSECPTMALMANVMHEGDELGWHFDTNDGVVSILLQAPDEGGEFEFAPYIRDEDDERYDYVASLFGGEREADQLALEPGTFALFLGRRSAHRVTPVGPTRQPRVMLLLSYDERPGMAFTEEIQASVRNPSNEPFLGTPASQ